MTWLRPAPTSNKSLPAVRKRCKAMTPQGCEANDLLRGRQYNIRAADVIILTWRGVDVDADMRRLPRILNG